MPTTITTRVEDELIQEIDSAARAEAIDRSAMIRFFLTKAIKEWEIQTALGEYEEGKLTLWQAAKKCKLSLWEMIDEVKKRRVTVPYTLEDLKEDIVAL